jgi:hypothetical protein
LREEGVYQRKCSTAIAAVASRRAAQHGGARVRARKKKSMSRAAAASFQESSIKRIKVFGCCLLSNFSPILRELSLEISLVGGRHRALAGAARQQGS